LRNDAVVGYLGRQWRRINQRVVEKQWLDNLREYMPVTVIPPSYIQDLMGPSIESLLSGMPDSLDQTAAVLKHIRDTYGINTLYLNLPTTIPIVLMARNHAGLDLGICCIAHCVGSAYWLKLWVSIAPWLTKRDVVMVSSACSKQALMNISPKYEHVRQIPLGIRLPEAMSIQPNKVRSDPTILSIGRIEDVKNIHIVLTCFAKVLQQIPAAKLVIAGEYTGHSEEQVAQYEQTITTLLKELQLEHAVELPGAVVGASKDELFQRAHILLNLSTDIGETYGFNLIEAKAWGLPVICTSWNGFRELVHHGEDGYLADCRWEGSIPVIDQAQVVQYCLQLLLHSDLHSRFAEQARLRARNYAYEKTTPRIVAALHDAVQIRAADGIAPSTLRNQSLASLPNVYAVERMEQLGWSDETPAALIPTSFAHYEGELEAWYAKVKPIMKHYASTAVVEGGRPHGMEIHI